MKVFKDKKFQNPGFPVLQAKWNPVFTFLIIHFYNLNIKGNVDYYKGKYTCQA